MAEMLTREALCDILAFYQEAGVDDALEETPVNRLLSAARLAEQRPPAAPAVQPAPVPPKDPPTADRPKGSAPYAATSDADRHLYDAVPDRLPAVAAVPDEKQAMLARELAQSATTLEELRAHLAAFEGCNLRSTAKNLVF